MEIRRATVEDAAAILALQKLAYQSIATLYQNTAIPPLTQSLKNLTVDFDRTTFLKVEFEPQRIIGSVRAFQVGPTVFVERLIVAPEHRRQGIGTALMRQIEAQFSGVQRFELYTGHKSETNVRLCERLGYRELKRERMHNGLTFVFMEKMVGTFSFAAVG